MKKLILFTLVSLLFIGVNIGQKTSEHFSKKNALKINPTSFGNAKFQLSYERFLGDRNSSILFSPSIVLKDSYEESKIGWEIMGQYRFYLTHLRKDKQKTFLGVYNYGFYAGMYGLYSNYEEDYMRYFWDSSNSQQQNEEVNKEVKAAEGGALIGMQIDITPRILIDFYVGGGIRTTEVSDTYLDNNTPEYYEPYGVFDPEYKGVKPTIGLLLGITF